MTLIRLPVALAGMTVLLTMIGHIAHCQAGRLAPPRAARRREASTRERRCSVEFANGSTVQARCAGEVLYLVFVGAVSTQTSSDVQRLNDLPHARLELVVVDVDALTGADHTFLPWLLLAHDLAMSACARTLIVGDNSRVDTMLHSTGFDALFERGRSA